MRSHVSVDMITLFPYIASGAFSLGLVAIALLNGTRRREVSWFAVVLALESAWAATFVLEVMASTPTAKLFWDALHWPLIVLADASILFFARAYVDPVGSKRGSALLAALFVPSALALAAALAAIVGYTGFLYETVSGSVLPFTQLAAVPSVFARGLTFYGYALFVVSCVVLALRVNAKGLRRSPGIAIVLAGFLLQLGSTLAAALAQARFGSALSSPLWAMLRDLLVAYGLFGERLLGPLDNARHAVMDTLLDPVFVLGKDENVVDCNSAGQTLLGAGSADIIGKPARALFERWPSEVSAALNFPEAETELDLPDRDGAPSRSYRITVASSAPGDRLNAWKLLVFNDISGQKRDARDLAASNEELEFWVRQRTAALRQEVAQRTAAENRLRELNEEMAKTQKEILWTLSEVVESRSRETAYHVIRVGEYARILSEAYGLSEEEVDIITAAAPMHDVSKIAIPDSILSKPGLLTDDEREVMKRHTVIGKEILGTSTRPLLRAAAIIALEHHERWDGKGYPLGKTATDISLSGRIVSLCDVFDALFTKRVYKDAWPLEKVLALFKDESGGAFEPRLVDILFEHIDDFVDVTKRFKDEPAPALPLA